MENAGFWANWPANVAYGLSGNAAYGLASLITSWCLERWRGRRQRQRLSERIEGLSGVAGVQLDSLSEVFRHPRWMELIVTADESLYDAVVGPMYPPGCSVADRRKVALALLTIARDECEDVLKAVLVTHNRLMEKVEDETAYVLAAVTAVWDLVDERTKDTLDDVQGVAFAASYLEHLVEVCSAWPQYVGNLRPDRNQVHQTCRVLPRGHRAYRLPAENTGRIYRHLLNDLPDESPRPTIASWDSLQGRRRILLLGDPGFGKTWLLKREARTMATELINDRAPIESTAPLEIPIFLRAPALADEVLYHDAPADLLLCVVKGATRSLATQLGQASWERACRWLADQFRKSWSPRLIIDALDEVDDGTRQRLWPKLHDLVGERRAVVSSRIVGYERPSYFDLDARDVEVELLPLMPEQSGSLVDAWLADLPEANQKVHDAVAQGGPVATLARVPLLATLLCVLAVDDGDLPVSRPALLDAVIRKLLGRTHGDIDQHRTPDEVDDLVDLASRIAWWFATGGEEGVWRDQVARSTVRDFTAELVAPGQRDAGPKERASAFLKERLGELMTLPDAPEGPVMWAHRAIHEHLVGHYLATFHPGPADFMFRKWWLDPDWYEVVPTVAALSSAPDQLITGVADDLPDTFGIPTITATRMLAATSLPIDHSRADLVDRCWQLVTAEWSPARALAIAAVASLGDRLPPRDFSQVSCTDLLDFARSAVSGAHEALVARTDSSDAYTRQEAARAVTSSGLASDGVLWCLSEHDDPYVKTTALMVLAGCDERSALSALSAIARNGDRVNRQRAAYALAHRLSPAVDVLSDLATSSHENVRREAVAGLVRRFGDSRGVFDSLIGSTDPWIRLQAAKALAALPGDDGVITSSTLLALSSNDDLKIRREAVRLLSTRDLIPHSTLLSLTMDDDPVCRSVAAEALVSRCGVASSVVLELAQSRHEDVRRIGMRALSDSNCADVRQVYELVSHEHDVVRQAAVRVLCMRPDCRIGVLVAIARKRDDEVALVAAAELAIRGYRRGLEVLMRFVDHIDPKVRRSAAASLAIVPSISLDLLLRMTTHSCAGVRRQGLAAVLRHPDLAAARLALLVHSKYPDVGGTAAAALVARRDCDTDMLTALARHGADEVALIAANAMLTRGSDPDVPRLASIVLHGCVSRRRIAAALLARTREVPSGIVNSMTKSRDPDVRRHGAVMLVASRRSRGEGLGDLLSADPPEVAVTAASVMGRQGDERGLRWLFSRLDDGDESLRRDAANALIEVDHPDVAEALSAAARRDEAIAWRVASLDSSSTCVLKELCTHSNPDVRRRAAHALSKRGSAYGIEALSAISHHDTLYDIRSDAIDALERLGTTDAVESLLRMSAVKTSAFDIVVRLPIWQQTSVRSTLRRRVAVLEQTLAASPGSS